MRKNIREKAARLQQYNELKLHSDEHSQDLQRQIDKFLIFYSQVSSVVSIDL